MAEIVTIRGLEDLKRSLNKLPAVLQTEGLVVGVKDVANVIRDEAIVQAPMASGALKRSIKTRKSRESLRWTVIYNVRVIGRQAFGNAYYWWFVENGTQKMAVQPYIRPAFEAKHVEARKTIINRLKMALLKWK